MLSWFAKRRHRSRTAQNLYGSIVTQARAPAFYREAGVPDTVEGRFELLVLHVFLVLDRLGTEGPEGNALAQQLVDTFVADMDTTLRELGVGDMVVGKKVRSLAETFYGRLEGYRDALGAGGKVNLGQLLRDNLQLDREAGEAPGVALAEYVRDARVALRSQPLEKLEAGELNFMMAQPEG